MTQDHKRKSHHSAEAREIVAWAMERAAKMKAEVFDREEAMDRFAANYESILEHITKK